MSYPAYALHSREIAQVIVSLISSRLTDALSLKICKRGWLRQLPQADDLSEWLNILFVRGCGWSGLTPGPISASLQVAYDYDIWFITQRADGEETDDRLELSMDQIAALFPNSEWLTNVRPGGDESGCSILRAVPSQCDTSNPLEELLDTEEFRLMSGRIRLTVTAIESAA